ncbi:YHOE [Hepatospora eriocheir]|uniref:YHOE n=1 Tax=Hepatospora eriocheir TaxID=1081669 RepID=A0A1X0QFW1_9MICR|nr:YHOE [Hepatospora eriocheir]
MQANIVFIVFGPFFPFPITVRFNKKVIKSKKSILISNHICDYDWIYMLVLAYQWDKLEDFKFIMKKELSEVPLLGTILRFEGNVFLERGNKERDIEILTNKGKEFSMEDRQLLCFFPEGTYPDIKSFQKSIKYAEKSGIQHSNGACFIPKNVLLPRSSGFDILKDSFTYDGIIDATIFNNPYNFIYINESSLMDFFIFEKFPIAHFFHIEFFESSEVGDDFITQAFTNKDKILEKYNEKYDGKFINKQENVIKILDEVDIKNKNEYETATYYIKSKYRYLVYCFIGYFYIKLIFKFFSK